MLGKDECHKGSKMKVLGLDYFCEDYHTGFQNKKLNQDNIFTGAEEKNKDAQKPNNHCTSI